MWLQLKCIWSTFREDGNKTILPAPLAVITVAAFTPPWSETRISTGWPLLIPSLSKRKLSGNELRRSCTCASFLSHRWGYQKIESCLCVRHGSGILCFQRGWKRCGDALCCNIGWYVWSPHIHINIVMKRFHGRHFIHERRVWRQYPFCSLRDLGLYVQWVKNPRTRSTKKEDLVGVGRSDPQTFLNNSYVFSLKIF